MSRAHRHNPERGPSHIPSTSLNAHEQDKADRENGITPTAGRFCKKPVEVDAVQFDGTWPSVSKWLAEHGGSSGNPREAPAQFIPETLDGPVVELWGADGKSRALKGDWIVCLSRAHFCRIKPDIFEETYEAASADQGDAPDEISIRIEEARRDERTTVLNEVDEGMNRLRLFAESGDGLVLHDEKAGWVVSAMPSADEESGMVEAHMLGASEYFTEALHMAARLPVLPPYDPDYHPPTTLNDLPTDELEALYELAGVQRADQTSPALARARKWLSDAVWERHHGPIKKHSPRPEPGELQIHIRSNDA